MLGNEAADLDSVACAAAYAALLQHRGQPAVALVAVPRADLALRPETLALLAEQGVAAGLLLCSDEVEVGRLAEEGRCAGVTLVDHNALGSAHQLLRAHVTGVVDHHVDEGAFRAASPRVVAPVGSCATLVTELLAADAPALLADPALRRLLLGAVLLDTGGLAAPPAGRASDRDAAAVRGHLAPAVSDGELQALYRRLQALRNDQAGLRTRDLLRRDHKVWVLGGWRVGISSLALPLPLLAARGGGESVAQAVPRWAAEQGLDWHLTMAAFEGPSGFERHLAAWAASPAAAQALPGLLAALTPPLRLAPLACGWAGGVAFGQGELTASRKQVQPLVAAFCQAQPRG